MRTQTGSTEKASTYRDAGLSGMRRAEGVCITTVANAGANYILGADAMHATLPLKRASSQGRGPSEATPSGASKARGSP